MAIYHLRVVEQRPWREIGRMVGLSHSIARRRFYMRINKIAPADVAAMRQEESDKIDERERLASIMCRAAFEGGDYETALKALTTLDRVASSRRALWGLDVPVVQKVALDMGDARTRIHDAIAAYLAGVNDTTADATPTD